MTAVLYFVEDPTNAQALDGIFVVVVFFFCFFFFLFFFTNHMIWKYPPAHCQVSVRLVAAKYCFKGIVVVFFFVCLFVFFKLLYKINVKISLGIIILLLNIEIAKYFFKCNISPQC